MTPAPSTPSVSAETPTTTPFHPTALHPAAALFPMLDDAELKLLADDIAAHGLLEPIERYRGEILDGRNRLRACELAGVPPRFVEWNGEGSVIAFVLSRNLHRRHLSESQRSVVAARAKEMFKKEAAERTHAHQFGSRPKTPAAVECDNKKPRVPPAGANLRPPCAKGGRADAQAASVLNVSARLVTFASRVLAEGDEQLVAAIDAGWITVTDAVAVVGLPKEKQREALAMVRSGKARTLRQAIAPPPCRAKPPAATDDDNPTRSPGRLRRAYKRFAELYERLCREVDAASLACGGVNDYTSRAREALAVALRAMHECVNEFGRRAR